MTRLSRREQALCDVIATLQMHVEELGCTCPDLERKNKLHSNKSRRRKDSACTGVALAVTAEMRRRRALRLRERD